MKFGFNVPSALVGLAVGALLAGGVAFATGESDGAGTTACLTRAGYVRIPSSGECRRSETVVELPRGAQGPQGVPGPQGEPGVDGRAGSDADVESVRCRQMLAAGADLHGCDIATTRVRGLVDLSGSDLSDARFSVSPFRAVQIGVGDRFACARLANKDVQCWGRMYNPFTRDYQPVSVPADLPPATDLSVGAAHVCAVDLDQQVRCWGYGWTGSGHSAISVPARIGPVKRVFSGAEADCAVLVSGSVRCWGWADWGITDPPADLADVSSVSVAAYHACAALRNGDVRCWGRFNVGGLALPSDLPAVRAMSSAGLTTCFLGRDDSVRCISDSDSSLRNVPEDLPPVVQLAVTDLTACALTAAGSVRCWGARSGSLGGDGFSGIALSNTVGVAMSPDGSVQGLYDQGPNSVIPVPTNVATADADVPWIDLSAASIDGADLSALRVAELRGCGVAGTPARLPIGWTLRDGCFERT